MELEKVNYAEYLQVSDGKPVTTSKIIAEVFGKEHKNVLRDIQNLLESAEIGQLNFGLSSYTNSQNKQQPLYVIDRDGFMLLGMGFTGKEALVFKIGLIKAFNAMETELIKRNSTPMSMIETLQIALAQAIEIEEQKKLIEVTKPKVEYFDNVLQSDTLITTTIIASDLGYSAVAFNKLLHGLGIQKKTGNQWVMTSKYVNKGYMHTKTHSYQSVSSGEQKTSHTSYWTESGRKFLIDTIKYLKNK